MFCDDIDHHPFHPRFKPLIAFFVLAVLFLLDLVLATQV